jgi:hypothetical protein
MFDVAFFVRALPIAIGRGAEKKAPYAAFFDGVMLIMAPIDFKVCHSSIFYILKHTTNSTSVLRLKMLVYGLIGTTKIIIKINLLLDLNLGNYSGCLNLLPKTRRDLSKNTLRK